jgi:CRISPR/Cas system CMR-associated protein Cmr1 (group 7 of RAMP superfamily)
MMQDAARDDDSVKGNMWWWYRANVELILENDNVNVVR